MARYYPGDHDDTVVKPLPLGVGRQNDEEAKDTSVVLAQNVEGGKVGDTVQVSANRANWLLMHGIASRPEDWVDQYPADGITEPVVFNASKRRASLEHQHEGLVFGRLDLDHSEAGDGSGGPRDREVRYIGRLGVRDDDYEPL